MQPFQGIVRGRGRQPATQLGSKQTGLVTETNTINWGITVDAQKIGEKVIMRIYRTGGSTGKRSKDLIAVIDNGEVTQVTTGGLR